MEGTGALSAAEYARYKELKDIVLADKKLESDKKVMTKSEKNEFKALQERKKRAANEEVGGATASSKVPERGGAKTGGASSSGKQLGVPVRKASPIASSQEPAASSSANGDGGNSGADNKATAKRKSTTGLARKQKEMVVTEDQIEPENRWWDKPDLELSKAAIKWNSLEHHGILFPPEYQPHGAPLHYGPENRQEQIVLPPSVEELATYWCANIGLEAESKDLFINNFWGEFRSALEKTKDVKLIKKITNFRYCNFGPMKAALNEERERRKNMSKEDKEAEKEMRLKAEEQFRYCLIDGYREKVGTIRVEPPGLFKGRGEHPKQGKLKDRIMPENVTMNCDNCLPPPICTMPGRAWEQVVHDDSVNWLGYYKQETDEKENIKYIQMDKTSEMKTKPDLMKYERARRLCELVQEIRRDYQAKICRGETLLKKQLGTCAYFIDRLALRVGGEKNTEEEADTVGCTSLRVEHVKLDFKSFHDGRAKITLDFLGKDSIRYLNEVPVPQSVFKNLALFMQKKKGNDQLFDDVSPSEINAYLQEFMPDLTAKVFRTYNASYTLEQQLALWKPEEKSWSQPELLSFYNEANRKVAILCNHQKAVSKNHEAGVEKLKDKNADMQSRLEALCDHLKRLKNGSSTDYSDKDKFDEKSYRQMPKTEESCKKAVAVQLERINKSHTDLQMKDTNKNVSLTTSKINYMDPRITIAFCKRSGLDVSKVFSKTILQKFPWAIDIAEDYKFVRAGAAGGAAANGANGSLANGAAGSSAAGNPGSSLKRSGEAGASSSAPQAKKAKA